MSKNNVEQLIEQSQLTTIAQGAEFAKYKMAIMELANNANLAHCELSSIVHSGVRIVELGLHPNPMMGEAFVVPRGVYKDKKLVKYVAEIQISVKGYSILGYRSGWIFNSAPVYKCDKFSVNYASIQPQYTLEPNFEKRDEENPDWVYKNLVTILCFAKDNKGNTFAKDIRFAKLEKIRIKGPKQEKGFLKDIWKEWSIEMYTKSALKYSIKRWPVESSTIRQAIWIDEEFERETPLKQLPTANQSTLDMEISTEEIEEPKGDLVKTLKNLGLDFFTGDNFITIVGNALKQSTFLQKMGFKVVNGDWIKYFDSIEELIFSISEVELVVKTENNKTFYGLKEPKNTPIVEHLIELGFAWCSKNMWLLIK